MPDALTGTPAVLLPPAATALERAMGAALAPILAIPTPVDTLWDADACPAALLPWLAAALSVDDWDPGWTEATKRAVIKASVEVHRRKGTIGALRRALQARALDLIKIVEWDKMDPPGPPHTFRLEVGVTERGVSPDEWDGILAAVAATKNVRSHLTGLKVAQQVAGADPRLAAAAVTGGALTVYPWQPTDLAAQGAVPYRAAAVHTWTVTTIEPGHA